ncbi:MAG: ABC transporter permease [Clostridiales bacterium]|nr:ABC transporter permease [Clostridiales bacterium]
MPDPHKGSRAKHAPRRLDNIVPLIFIIFTAVCLLLSNGVSFAFFLNELSSRFFRNAFLVLSLIIPVVAGLGLNFGIVVGAMAAQLAILFIRYHGLGGMTGLILTFALSAILAALFGWLTGLLYNRTKGQEMIASLIVGYFATGVYQFILLFVVGVIIPVPAENPLIKPDGLGVLMSVDLIPVAQGGLRNSLDRLWRIPFPASVLLISLGILAWQIIQYLRKKHDPALGAIEPTSFILSSAACGGVAVFCIISMITNNFLTMVSQTPVVTGLLILTLCLFTNRIMRTKLGQDFRSVGQNQHIAAISGIHVDKTRIIAVIMSTVLAAWGHIIYMQNMGTLATYDTHRQIGLFSVAALLVGGASTSKATVMHALTGTLLFNAMFIMSPEIGKAVFGNAMLGEYFRTFMVYGVIGVALGLYVWQTAKQQEFRVEHIRTEDNTQTFRNRSSPEAPQ